MSNYSVKELSKLAGVSVRTLHYYDQIGLLSPRQRTSAGYRQYGKRELTRLQQIMFFRELNFPLRSIKEILDKPGFDLLESLEFHLAEMESEIDRLKTLTSTIRRTIDQLKKKKEMLTDDEMYKGFSKEEKEVYRKEVVEKWGEDQLLASEEKLRQLTTGEFDDIQAKGEAVNELLAEIANQDPASRLVQSAINEHRQYLENFTEINKERYLGLARMYTTDERFRGYYDKYRKGLADFMLVAIEIYCENEMRVLGR